MAPEIGKTLRDARTEQGIELSEVERVTKIRERFLSAMEEDRWEELPAPVYAKGFLSTYARYLGLDEGPLLERFREEFGDPERPEHVPAGAVHTGEMRRKVGGPRTRSLVVAGLVTAVLLVLVIAAVIGGSDTGSGSGKETSKATVAAKPGHRTATSTTASSTTTTSTSTSTTTTTPATTPSQISVKLRSTADVWVCLVDQSGNKLVNSETLPADQTRGPFKGNGFEMTFGNGSVELTVNGQPVKVPQLAQPLGYRITTTETKRLKPSSQPTCV